MVKITGKRIEEALKNANISQKELAEQIGVSPAAISQYISGLVTPTDLNIFKICKVLDVSPIWLKGFDTLDLPRVDQFKTKYEVLIEMYDQMNEEGRSHLIMFAEDIIVKYRKENANG